MTPEEFDLKKIEVISKTKKFLEVGNELLGLKIELEELIKDDFRELAIEDKELITLEDSLNELWNALNY
jgi:hypothetical protein